jgi:hypothetical protein
MEKLKKVVTEKKLKKDLFVVVLFILLCIGFAFALPEYEIEGYGTFVKYLLLVVAILFCLPCYARIRSLIEVKKIKPVEEKEEGIWITKEQADEHFKSIGKPGYDHSIGMVRGRTMAGKETVGNYLDDKTK